VTTDGVNPLTDAIALAADGFHSCALLADGTAQCWGYNFFGQLGDGSTIDRPTPVMVELFDPLFWSSGDTTVASITQDGLATGLADGETTIAAATGEVSGEATLTVVPLTLTVALDGTTSGSGTVTIVPPVVECTPSTTDPPTDHDCEQDYGVDDEVTLTATAAADSLFGVWTNCDFSMDNVCEETMDADTGACRGGSRTA
jgi:hypothetical protein